MKTSLIHLEFFVCTLGDVNKIEFVFNKIIGKLSFLSLITAPRLKNHFSYRSITVIIRLLIKHTRELRKV